MELSPIEKRLQNTERCLLEIIDAIQDVLPPSTKKHVQKITMDWAHTNQFLGTNFDMSQGFDE